MKNFAGSLIAGMALAFAAFAHDAKGPHGGRLADAGNYHVELVVNDATVDVFITDAADKQVAPAGFKGTAVLAAGGKSHRIVLEPAEGRLSGKAPAPLPAEPKGVVQIATPDGKTAQARFQ